MDRFRSYKEQENQLKWQWEDDVAKIEWKKAGKDESTRTSKEKPKKIKVKESQDSRYIDGYFNFISSQDMTLFMGKLPEVLSNNRLFAVIVAQALMAKLLNWVKDAVLENTKQSPAGQIENNPQAITTVVNEDGEVHRFVASGIKALYSNSYSHWQKKCNIIKNIQKQLDDSNTNISKNTREFITRKMRAAKNMKTHYESVIELTKRAKITQTDLRKNYITYDKSYEDKYLNALDKGKLWYVHPAFLEWAKLIMKKTRALVNEHAIKKVRSNLLKKAYKKITNDDECMTAFLEIRIMQQYNEKVKKQVRTIITNFAFHARCAVEYKKYRAKYTDRAVDSRNKTTLREYLKAGGKKN